MEIAAKGSNRQERSTAQDVTERKQAETALKGSEEMFRRFVETSPDLLFQVNRAGRIEYVSPSATKMYGYEPHELIGKHLKTTTPAKEIPKALKALKKVLSGNPLKNFEINQKDKSGRIIPVEVNVVPIYKDEKIVGVQGVMRNITERKRAEEALKESEQKYRFLAENITDVVFIQDMNLNVTYVSPSVRQLFGYTIEEGLKLKIKDFMTLESLRKAMGCFQEKAALAQENEDVDIPLMEYEYVRKDGSTFWGEIKVAFLRDSKGRLVGSQGVLRDITQRKKAEQLMQALNKTAVAMEQAMTTEEIFATVAEQLTNLGFYCAALPTDKNQKKLHPEYLCYDAKAIKAVEELVKLKAGDFSIPIESVDVFKEVVWQKKTVFVEKAEEVLRQSLPWAARKFAKQIAKMLKVQKSIATPLILDGDVIALFSVQSDDLSRDDVPTINAFANQMSAALRKAKLMQDLQKSLAEQKRSEEELQRSYDQLRDTLIATVNTLASTVEMRDPYTAGHQRRVTILACAMAGEMDLPEEQFDGLRMAGLIHDLGKLTVPVEILNKAGSLSKTEFNLIKHHPQAGYNILKEIEFPWPVAQIVLQHHERMDGSGYPQGLKGEEILLEARILAVADVVEAMASHRPYRAALGIEAALEDLRKNRATLYGPDVVDACLKLFTEKEFKFE